MNFYYSSSYVLDEGCVVTKYKGKPGLEVPDEIVCSPKHYFSDPANVALLIGALLFIGIVIVVGIIKRKQKLHH